MQSSTRLALFSSIVLLAPAAGAQVASIVGPQIAPPDCPIITAISNDGPASVVTGVCTTAVRDAATGEIVFDPFLCPAIGQIIPPGGTYIETWNQLDNSGEPVPPGDYLVDVVLPSGAMETHPITIGGADAALAALGVPKIGTTRKYRLCSPQDAGFPYLLMASGSMGAGLPTCEGTPLFLTPDDVFQLSLSTPGTFQNFFGNLGATGFSSSPQIALPVNPNTVGLELVLAFVVLDLNQACPIRRVSSPLVVTIQ